jgi:integrase
MEVLQEDELQNRLALFAGTREYTLLAFAATECRRGELLALQVTDV